VGLLWLRRDINYLLEATFLDHITRMLKNFRIILLIRRFGEETTAVGLLVEVNGQNLIKLQLCHKMKCYVTAAGQILRNYKYLGQAVAGINLIMVIPFHLEQYIMYVKCTS